MSFIARIIAGMLVGDLLCLWFAHRRLRHTPAQRRWRVGLLLFFALQIAGLALLLFGRTHDLEIERLFTKPVLSAVFIWHFFGVSLFLLLLAVHALLGLARRL